MGCCALGTKDLVLGQRCFSRVVQLFPDDSEAWNNLAAVYIKQEKKYDSFFILQLLPVTLSPFALGVARSLRDPPPIAPLSLSFALLTLSKERSF